MTYEGYVLDLRGFADPPKLFSAFTEPHTTDNNGKKNKSTPVEGIILFLWNISCGCHIMGGDVVVD